MKPIYRDEEINRAVAQAVGWEYSAAEKCPEPPHFKCTSGWWRRPSGEWVTEGSLPDFLHSWEAAGQLWEWAYGHGFSPTLQEDVVHSGQQQSMIWCDRIGNWITVNDPNPRRALALAFLKAHGETEASQDEEQPEKKASILDLMDALKECVGDKDEPEASDANEE